MDLRSLPALPPALGVVLGAAAALAAGGFPVPGLVALLALGIALGRWPGLLVAGLASGCLAVTVQAPGPGSLAPRVDAARPLTVEGRVARPWWASDWGWRGEIEVARVRQGHQVLSGGGLLRVELASAEPPPAAGARIRARGYLRRAPGYANRLAVAPGPWSLRIKTARHVEVVEPAGPLARAATVLRDRVEAAYDELDTSTPGPALARALVLGDPSALPAPWRRGLRRAGLAHLLAVSGLHAALVAGLTLVLTAPLPRALRIVAAVAAVIGYLGLVGPRPSLLRATGMVLIAGAAWSLGRGGSGRNALAVAAAVLVLEHPEWVLAVGFQLTVAATAGLVFGGPWIESLLAERLGPESGRRQAGRPSPGRGRPVRRWLLRSLAATVAAQAAALPFAVPAFHLASWTAPLLNLVAVPYTAAVLALSLGWTAVALVRPVAARGLVPLLDAAASPFGWPALGPPALWGTLAVRDLGQLAGWLALAIAAAAVARAAAPSRRLRLPLGIGLAASALLVAGWAGRSSGGRVELTLLDVGQGDAILLQDGDRSVLVDGGGWRYGDFGGRVLLPALLGQGVRRLDAVAATHADTDHCRGLVDVASYLPIGQVWLGPGWRRQRCAEELSKVPHATVATLRPGARLRVGRWRLSALYPPPVPGFGHRPSDRNDLSLVLLAEAEGRRVLLTGDLHRQGERELVRGWGVVPFPVDVLKVAHHGSKTSSGRQLLAATRPRLALISAGRGNRYGHPAAEVVERLEASGSRVLTTARQGQITLSWRRGEPMAIELPATPP